MTTFVYDETIKQVLVRQWLNLVIELSILKICFGFSRKKDSHSYQNRALSIFDYIFYAENN